MTERLGRNVRPTRAQFADLKLDLGGITRYGLSVVVFFEKTKRLKPSCRFKRKHFFSTDIIIGGIGSVNATPAERNFVLKRLISPRWEVEETIITDGHFSGNLL